MDGTNTSWQGNFTAMSLDGRNNSITNNGLIYAKKATAMKANSSAQNSTVTNDKNGVIAVDENGFGMVAGSNSTQNNNFVNKGSIYVQGTGAVGIRFEDGASNNIITNEGTIIANEGSYAIQFAPGNSDNGKILNNTLNLKNGSHIEGIVEVTGSTSINIKDVTNEKLELSVIANKYEDPDKNTAALSNLTLENSNITFVNKGKGEKLRFTNITFVDDSTFAVDKNSEVNINGKIDVAKGNANFEVSDLDQLYLKDSASVLGDGNINTHYVGGTVADKLATGEYTTKEIIQDSVQYQLGQLNYKDNYGDTIIDGGYVGGDTVIKANENGDFYVASTKENGFTASAMDLAKLNALAWRSELTTITDRLTTIRSTPDVAGVWVRYKGGEWDGDDVNQQFNGFELGVDKMITPNFLVGVSASYVKGDGDLDYGSSDNEIYSGAVYFSGFNGGWFVDVVGKVGRVSTDFDLSYNGLQDSGNYDQLGYLLGVETGYRFNFDNFFVEPQVQLTYSYLSDEEVTTSNRDIDFDEQKSFIGRVGFMSGYNFNDLGSVYLHASYYHDFDGDVDASFSLKNADNYVSESDELDSNWGDIGLGADLHLGNATLFVEGARTYGGDIDLEWTANAGVRYTF